jgi:GrpB-like predicted nucleotidyltransferase (UPF0157 family)
MILSLDERIQRAVKEEISIVPYNPEWISSFQFEKEYLLSRFTSDIIVRIEHFGSTAVPGLCAKPVIDMLAEVRSLDEAKKIIVPVLESEGYEYFWRPVSGDTGPDFYAWFIKRNKSGIRTHHIHMVEKESVLWERLLFRDYLKISEEDSRKYAELKYYLAEKYPNDRVSYTNAKTEFITFVTKKAKNFFNKKRR